VKPGSRFGDGTFLSRQAELLALYVISAAITWTMKVPEDK